MTILAAGYGLRNLANQGMRSVAELEAQENAIADQLDAAEQAQKTQMYSTGAGIGGAYGVQKALEAGKAAKTAQASSQISNAISATPTTGGLEITKLASDIGGSTLTSGGINNVAGVIDGVSASGTGSAVAGVAEGAGTAAELSGGINNVANALKAAELAEGGVAIAEGTAAAEGATTAVAAAEGTTVAAGSSGWLATLGTIAAPIAIGLGVAFLLNKLFD
jgi:hypothetical protein